MTTASSYKVFARTYRPKTFGEVVGQDIAVRIFQNALKQNTLSHAILLTGIRGIGKTTSARLLAKTLSCLNSVDDIDPCGACDSCIAFDRDQHTDIIEMDAASHTGVDDIRDIIEGVAYAPTYGRYRVYIIDEVHMLSKNAFNALLKTLEEPPAHAKFIFATTELEKVPETIVSRCLQIQLRPMSIETILGHLQKISAIENLPADMDGLTLIAEAAKGSMRDGLSILEKVSSYTRSTGESMTMDVVERILGRPPKAELERLCQAIKSGNIIPAIQSVRSLFSHDIEPIAITKGLLNALHQSLCNTIGMQQNNPVFFKELSTAQLNRLWSIVHNSVQELITSPVPQESCEVMLIRLCHVSDIPPLKQLIQDIENKLVSTQSVESIPSQSRTPASAVQTQPISKKSDLTRFDRLIEWVETQKDPHLSFFLKRDLRVHGFKPGYIECSLKNPEDQHLLKHLKHLLQTELNENWTFELVHSTTAIPATFHEQAQTDEANAKQRVIDSELVQHALHAFEGANVTVDRMLLDS